MQVSVPSMSEVLSYTAIGSTLFTALIAVLVATTGNQDLVAAVLVLAVAAGTYWLACRNATTIITAKLATALFAVLLALCAVAAIVTRHPYHGFLFLVAAAALGAVFALRQQGTRPMELRIAGILAVSAAPPTGLLRMLEALREAGVLTAEEFAAKSAMLDEP